MMPNVTRGDRAVGLMMYLAGEGKRNEHTEPHVVAGDPAVMAWHMDEELDRSSALALGRHLDQPKRVFGVEVKGGHVWHCSLSLRAEEGQLSDSRWQRIAEDFVELMGFDDQQGTRAPTRWAAVRHGLSEAGNDHIHIAVNLVREDGTRANIHHDFSRSQKAAGELEKRHGLQLLESREAGLATRGFHAGEREAQARRRAIAKHDREHGAGAWHNLPSTRREQLVAAQLAAEHPRQRLERLVRACAVASDTEAEFVRRVRSVGLLARPRFASGRGDVVLGWSVAQRPAFGERPIWYGGGTLARDLSLPAMRRSWADTPQVASEAVAEWTAAYRSRRPIKPGREAQRPRLSQWEETRNHLAGVREQLRGVPHTRQDTWTRAARDVSGALGAWSLRREPTPGELARASKILARSAQAKTSPTGAPQTVVGSRLAMLLMAGASDDGPEADAILLHQIGNLMRAIHDWHLAADRVHLAKDIERVVRTDLRDVAATLPDVDADRTATSTLSRTGREARVGDRAIAVDRGNLGTVTGIDDDGTVIVHFYNRDTGTSATRALQRHEVRVLEHGDDGTAATILRDAAGPVTTGQPGSPLPGKLDRDRRATNTRASARDVDNER